MDACARSEPPLRLSGLAEHLSQPLSTEAPGVVDLALAPLFAQPTAEAFEAELEYELHRGALLWMRHLVRRHGVAWTPPDADAATMLRDLARVASVRPPVALLDFGLRLVAQGALPAPVPAVQASVMKAFAQATDALCAVSADRGPAVTVSIDDRTDPAWWARHPSLVVPAWLTLGHVLVDPTVVRVALELRLDPEDDDLETIDVLCATTDDPSDFYERMDAAKLASGVIGTLVDANAASVVVLATPALAA